MVPLTSGRQSGDPDRAGQSPRRKGFGSQPKGSGFIPQSPAGGKHNPYLLINVMYLEKISNFTLACDKIVFSHPDVSLCYVMLLRLCVLAWRVELPDKRKRMLQQVLCFDMHLASGVH